MKTYNGECGGYVLYASTDRGRVKGSNEDCFGIFEPETEELLNSRGILVVLADGMGGLFRGGRASRTMVDAMGEYYYKCRGEDAADLLRSAFKEGNKRVFEQVGEGVEIKAGTTCTSAVLFDGSINIAHAGDSRAYLIEEDSIRQLTKDHSYVASPGNAEGKDGSESDSHRRRVMTRSVGVKRDVKVEVLPGISCTRDDVLLLCSDGLFSLISEEEILSVVRSVKAGKVCSKLTKLALKAGGEDNITVVMAKKV